MSDLKDQLIKLGAANPALQKHIRPVLSGLESASTKLNIYLSDPPKVAREFGFGEPYVENTQWGDRFGLSGVMVFPIVGGEYNSINLLKEMSRRLPRFKWDIARGDRKEVVLEFYMK